MINSCFSLTGAFFVGFMWFGNYQLIMFSDTSTKSLLKCPELWPHYNFYYKYIYIYMFQVPGPPPLKSGTSVLPIGRDN